MKTWLTIVFLIAIASFTSCIDDDGSDSQTQTEIKQIDEYITASGTSDFVLYDNSTGIRFVIHQFGENPPPHDGQRVYVNYQARLFSDMSIFDQGVIDNEIEDVTQFGQGLRYCLRSMMEGTAATLYIPSYLGFGSSGTTDVPPNSILVYNVFLQKVTRTVTEQQQFEADTAAIKGYLQQKSIAAIPHPSGIFYKIEQQGSGDSPHSYDFVNFNYTLKLLSNDGSVVQQKSSSESSVFGVIDGLKVGFQLINEGSKATFYIPSGLAYGKTASGDIPANSNLIFEITLNSVIE